MQANGLSFEYNKIQPKMTILCPIHYVTIPLKTSKRWGNFPTVCSKFKQCDIKKRKNFKATNNTHRIREL